MMHNPPLRQIVGVGIVLRDAIIPDRHVILLPAPAHLKLRFGNVREQEPQQRIALLLRDINNARREAPVSYTHLTLPTICSV